MQQTILFIKTELADFYPRTEIQNFVFLLLEFVCSIDKQSILSGKDKKISLNERILIERYVAELKKHRPIQYITGETEFFGLPFKIQEGALIPRPETEELVEWITESVNNNRLISILDIGTGSGCIAVALAKKIKQSQVSAVDISEKALELAKVNANKNDVEIIFLKKDILRDDVPGKWDVIVSNPPYITPKEKEHMSANVLEYEPHEALFVPQKKPLLFYERIADIAINQLNPGGYLFFEINSSFGEVTANLLIEKGFQSVTLRKDISGNDRMIKAQL